MLTALAVVLLLGVALYLTSLYSFLLFHTLAEFFSIIIAGTVFVLAWNSRAFIKSGYLLFLGISLLFVGAVDTLHTLAYRGMNVLPHYDADLPTQLWIAARYMQSLSFLFAFAFTRRPLRAGLTIAAFTAVTVLLLASIFIFDVFPTAFVEGVGLTPFKVYSEFAIVLILGASIFLLYRNRTAFEPDVRRFLAAALIYSIITELAFTFYVDVYGLSNLIGHYFKIAAFFYIYKAIIETGFIRPYNLLLRDYKEREQALIQNISLQKRLEMRAKNAATEADRRAQELDAVFQSLVEAVIVYDEQGQPVRSNPALVKMYGFDPVTTSRDEMLARLRIRREDDSLHTSESLPSGRALKGILVRDEIMKFDNADGQELQVMASGSPLYLQDKLIGAVAVWHDVTEQVQAAQRQTELLVENRRQREMLARLVNEAPVGIAFLQGSDHRLSLVNAAFMRIARIETDPTGLRLGDVFPGHSEAIQALLDEVHRTGQPINRVDEAHAVVEAGPIRYFTYTMTPLFANQETVEGILLMATDTTEEVQARLALDEERARLKAIIETSPVGILVADQEQRVILSNPAARTLMPHLWPDATLYVNEDFRVLTPEGREMRLEERPLYRSIQERKAFTNVEMIFERPGEPQRFLLVNTAPIHDESGELIGAVSLVQDITERKEVEAELEHYAARLEHSNAELQQFAFVVSHDLQEPLRKIRAFGERLTHHAGSRLEEQERDFLNRMTNAAQRMQIMIDDMLAYSRITTKANPFEQVNLSQIVEEVLSDLEVRIERTGGKVIVGALPEIEGDPVQIRQLLQNLLSNALKYHRQGVPPEVEIAAAVNGEEVEISITDNGIGFDPVHSERIFQPFERLHGRSAYEGTGMGLAICRKIVERHQGQIRAESQPGRGTKFITLLPLYQARSTTELVQP